MPIVSPTVGGWMIMTALSGLGFGCFQAVDQALMSEVLPSAKSYAKDLGVVNIAATLPQTLAPAVAGAIVVSFGFVGLFPVGIVLSVLGAFAVWNLVLVWGERPRRWWGRIGNALIAIVCLATLWLAMSLHLLSFSLHY